MSEHGMEGGGGKGERAEKKLMESTPKESELIEKYLNVKAQAHNPLQSEAECKRFAEEVEELMGVLYESPDIGFEFSEDFLRRVKTLSSDHARIYRAVDAFRQLELASAGGIFSPQLYDQAAGLMQSAIHHGVPATTFDPFEQTLRDYGLLAHPQSPL